MSDGPDNLDLHNLDCGKAEELGLCLVAFVLGFAGVSGAIWATGLALGFGARHAERWPQKLKYLQDSRPLSGLVVPILVALLLGGFGSTFLYWLGSGLRLALLGA